jgi:hypothetical protein
MNITSIIDYFANRFVGYFKENITTSSILLNMCIGKVKKIIKYLLPVETFSLTFIATSGNIYIS